MSYAQVSDITARYPNRDLVQITNEDPAATTVNTIVIQQALTDASSEIDTYLESRFSLPLSDPPAVLTRLCCDIAMYRMQSLRPLHDLEDARNRYDDAIKMMLRVNDGTLSLGLSPDNQEPPEALGAVQTDAGGDPTGQLPNRVFRRGTLRGF